MLFSAHGQQRCTEVGSTWAPLMWYESCTKKLCGACRIKGHSVQVMNVESCRPCFSYCMNNQTGTLLTQLTDPASRNLAPVRLLPLLSSPASGHSRGMNSGCRRHVCCPVEHRIHSNQQNTSSPRNSMSSKPYPCTCGTSQACSSADTFESGPRACDANMNSCREGCAIMERCPLGDLWPFFPCAHCIGTLRAHIRLQQASKLPSAEP